MIQKVQNDYTTTRTQNHIKALPHPQLNLGSDTSVLIRPQQLQHQQQQ